MIGYVVLTLLLFLAGVLAGIKMAWLDAYYKSREDAKASFSIYERQSGLDAAIERRKTDGAVSTWPQAETGSAHISYTIP